MKNKFDLSHQTASSTWLHALTPFTHQRIVPGDVFDVKNRYMIDFEPAASQVMSNFTFHVMWVYAPMWQLYADWDKFWNKEGGLEAPYFDFDIANNTDRTKLGYYLLPSPAVAYNVDIVAYYHRLYWKTMYDLFMDKILRISGIPTPSDFYDTAGGEDTTTLQDVGFVPFNSDYMNECLETIRMTAATSITSPFSIDDIKAALVIDNFNRMRSRFGSRIRDFMDKIFNIKRKQKESVEVINYYSTKLQTNDIVNVADDQGKIVSKTFGVTPNVNFKHEFDDYGILMGLYFVTCDDLTYAKGIPTEILLGNQVNANQEFHPENQGLAYEQVHKLEFTDSDLNVTGLDPIASTEIYNKFRRSYNRALGEFSRAARVNQIPHIQTGHSCNQISDLIVPDETTFTNLFANTNHHITMVAKCNIQAQRPIAKVMTHENIVREFDSIEIY